MIRYVVYGGYVISKHDAQEHYVGPTEVARLYGVNPSECIMARTVSETIGYKHDRYVWLGPDSSGRYELEVGI